MDGAFSTSSPATRPVPSVATSTRVAACVACSSASLRLLGHALSLPRQDTQALCWPPLCPGPFAWTRVAFASNNSSFDPNSCPGYRPACVLLAQPLEAACPRSYGATISTCSWPVTLDLPESPPASAPHLVIAGALGFCSHALGRRSIARCLPLPFPSRTQPVVAFLALWVCVSLRWLFSVSGRASGLPSSAGGWSVLRPPQRKPALWSQPALGGQEAPRGHRGPDVCSEPRQMRSALHASSARG